VKPVQTRHTILVVEDNPLARQGVTAVLQGAGYQVVQAADGQEALDLLHAGPAPDLILLDMLLPVLDGWLFLERIQREGPHPRPPIVITTGTILTREWAKDKGCAGFVRKPVEPEALLTEVSRCLGQP
jgi:two-component system chemotaxis response regulator CheY